MFSDNNAGQGGALLVGSPNPLVATQISIEDNVFTGNIATHGAALHYSGDGSIVVSGNTFANNSAETGGAVRLSLGEHALSVVENNEFNYNSAQIGGAVTYASAAQQQQVLRHNLLTGNQATVAAGALYLNGSSYLVEANEAAMNSAGTIAGPGSVGFAHLENSSVRAENNYLVQNGGGYQAAVWWVDGGSSLVEVNDTVVGSSNASYALAADPAAAVTVINCIYGGPFESIDVLQGVDSLSYTCSTDDLATLGAHGNTVGAGMVYASPEFDSSRFPALLETSPCIEAGSPAQHAALDFFGTARPQDFDGNGIATPDIGAYEAPGAPPILAPVYRFYNFTNNTHFFTSSAEEADSVIANYPRVFRYEGICYYTNLNNNTQPLYRFYNRVSASHFYTASAEEAAHIIATWPHIFTLDGQTYAVNPAPVPNSAPVYRFFNLKNGSHFYTASAEEADMVIATWPDVYRFEGPAFWIGL